MKVRRVQTKGMRQGGRLLREKGEKKKVTVHRVVENQPTVDLARYRFRDDPFVSRGLRAKETNFSTASAYRVFSWGSSFPHPPWILSCH